MKTLLLTILLSIFIFASYSQVDVKMTLQNDTLKVEKTITKKSVEYKPLAFYTDEIKRVNKQIAKLTRYKARMVQICKDYAPVIEAKSELDAATIAEKRGLRFYIFDKEIHELVK